MFFKSCFVRQFNIDKGVFFELSFTHEIRYSIF